MITLMHARNIAIQPNRQCTTQFLFIVVIKPTVVAISDQTITL